MILRVEEKWFCKFVFFFFFLVGDPEKICVCRTTFLPPSKSLLRVQIKRPSVRKFMISVLIADYRLPLQQSPNPGARERVGRQEGDGNFSNAFDLLNMARRWSPFLVSFHFCRSLLYYAIFQDIFSTFHRTTVWRYLVLLIEWLRFNVY